MVVTFKPGVSLKGVQPETAMALVAIASVFAARGVPLTITSCMDGQHMAGSLHYVGRAIDLRLPSRHTGRTQCDAETLADLKLALGADFDVVLESDHLHVEHDPKPKGIA